MRNPFVRRAGGVLSADIAVPDHERELAFYSTVLTTGGKPLWRDDMMNNQGTPIIGLGARTPEYENLPLMWMPHFQVADVAESATSTTELGGKELMHGKGEDGKSVWAVLTDPNGAAFGVIPVVADETESEDQHEQIGCIAWLSLTVPDVSSSREFYERVIGWNANSSDAPNSAGPAEKFEMMIDGEIAAAEICQASKGEEALPSVWIIHLPVNDLAESLRRVREHDGKVVKEFGDRECAVVRDPVGVYLALQSGH